MKSLNKPKLSMVPVLDELFHALLDYGEKHGPIYTVHGVLMGPDKYVEFLEATQDRQPGCRVFGAQVMLSTAHGDGITVY